MSAIIKSSDARASRIRAAPLGAPRPTAAPIPAVHAELAASRRELETLTQKLAEKNAETERLQEDVRRAFRDGEAEGREAGRKDADDGRAAALALLESGLAKATGIFDEALGCLEELSLAIAQTGLAKILGEDSAAKALLAAAIRRQIEALGAQAAIAVEVSGADFPDQTGIDELAAAIGRSGLSIAAIDSLKSGECRLRLALGSLEIGIPQQWARIKALLWSMAEGVDD